MTDRRFEDKSSLRSDDLAELSPAHPAMIENRTLYPEAIVEVRGTAPKNLLVSGENNRKIGKTVLKGEFTGYALYTLTLEERATCPNDCYVRGACYGNDMQIAPRNKVMNTEIFYARLEEEIKTLAAQNKGVMIGLHVLGDFFSAEYVAFWFDILETFKNVSCYGYTHHLFDTEIGGVIENVKTQFPNRFRIRWSFPEMLNDGATIVASPQNKIEDGVEGHICPAQTSSTESCASCALCWSASENCILFLRHSRQSETQTQIETVPVSEATKDLVPEAAPSPIRAIVSIEIGAKTVPATPGATPTIRMVDPRTLQIEASYQRSLTKKSQRLIQHIVLNFNWAKFKPPICAETKSGLYVIDGQHTAIAIVTHGGISQIPVLVIAADKVESRADAFVAHNRDKITMTVFDIFHAQVTAGDPATVAIAAAVTESGCTIPRSQPVKNSTKSGQITAVTELRAIHHAAGPNILRRILTIAAGAGLDPVTALPLRALRRMLTNDAHGWIAPYSDAAIAAAMTTIPSLDLAARDYAATTGQDRQRACIMLIKNALEKQAA